VEDGKIALSFSSSFYPNLKPKDGDENIHTYAVKYKSIFDKYTFIFVEMIYDWRILGKKRLENRALLI
jgi:hypothetical protein